MIIGTNLGVTGSAMMAMSFEQAKQEAANLGASYYITRSDFQCGQWQLSCAIFAKSSRNTDKLALWVYDFVQKVFISCDAKIESWSGNAFAENHSMPAFSKKMAVSNN